MDSSKFDWIEKARFCYEDLLKRFITMRTISPDPERKGDIVDCAAQAAELFEQAGISSKIIETPGYPIVLGEHIRSNDHPTAMIYGHLDVQSADPAEWDSHPFEFLNRSSVYFGRGTTDDKGPTLAAFMTVREAIRNKFPINFQALWEFEEEVGSTNFASFFEKNNLSIKPDVVLVIDGLWIDRDRPSIRYGLRGGLGLSLVLETGERDVHSGLAGGLARNPVAELADVISRCHDARTGYILIPGFYGAVRFLRDSRSETSKEIKRLLDCGFSRENFTRDLGLRSIRKMSDKEAISALKLLPTFEVHGIAGGYSGPGIKTIIPHRAEAKISIRTVPDQNNDAIFDLVSNHVRRLNPDVAVIEEKSLDYFYTDLSHEYFSVFAESVREALGKELFFDRSGGSIGALSVLAKNLQAPIIDFGLSLSEHGLHEKNEHFDWGQASAGMKVLTEFFRKISVKK